MRFLAVPGITGQEQAIGNNVARALKEIGVSARQIRWDRAHEKMPLPTQTGNLIVDLPGNRPGPRPLLFMTHLDTVPLCAGAVPKRVGSRIVPQGATALGGDNRTGVACLVTLIATLLEKDLSHAPFTFLFTVREESGLWGARHVDLAELGHPEMGFNVDGRSPRELTIGATGAERWEAEVFGRAAHAGVHPEDGISASIVTALAQRKLTGRVGSAKSKKEPKRGRPTSARSAMPARITVVAKRPTSSPTMPKIRGEARSSHDNAFNRAITGGFIVMPSRQPPRKSPTAPGKKARVRFTSRKDYPYPFLLKPTTPVVVASAAAGARRSGWEPVLRSTNGGLDANWLVRHGIPTVTFGPGQNATPIRSTSS